MEVLVPMYPCCVSHRVTAVVLGIFSLIGSAARSEGGVITKVTTSPSFFNPSLGQAATIEADLGRPGTLTLSIVDRDGFVVRTLPALEAKTGRARIEWDGKDDLGAVVPDEAYTPRIVFDGPGGRETYDPLTGYHPIEEQPRTRSYSRAAGVLSYTLSRPARVHIQAGSAVIDPKTGKGIGPVMKTIVSREPRVAGAVIETWNGFDVSGTIAVPELQHFVLAILATSLPDNALITVGNRNGTFLDYVRRLRRDPERAPHAERGPHHAGLSALEDHEPALSLSTSGSWDATKRLWSLDGKASLTIAMSSTDAEAFLSQPTEVYVYLDEKIVVHIERPANPLAVPLPDLAPGPHTLAVNWSSKFGPVAVAATRIERRAEPGQPLVGAR